VRHEAHVHDEICAACDVYEVEKVEAWLEKAMIDGMDRALNGPGVGGPRVPVTVETQISKTWPGSSSSR
jgi:DNA polymerase I-like protein with 3'-5' exonuclease and polymerase domains